jgi:23S rRNA pseudouridine1911/1915/1917 synthase
MASRTEQITVDISRPNERLDTYLHTQFPMVSRGILKRLIDQGHILVDGRQVKATHRPRAGERIQVHFPPPKPAEAQPEAIALDVLFEDDDLLVLNKPPDIVVHPGVGHDEHTLVNALLHHCAGRLSGIGGVARPGIVHRLDKETSGCLVVAKNDTAHLSLAEQFKSRQVEKIYLALLCGPLFPPKGEIRAAIGRHPTHRKRLAVAGGYGRDAHTSYRVLEILNEACLVEACLHTGRTHQIRVHFQHLGHPLVGDTIYGKRPNQRLREATGYEAPRQMLHAFRLAFDHPRTGQRVSFEAALPPDMEEARQTLRVNRDPVS